METFNPNWLALIASAVSTLVVGSIWYGPLFGKIWQKEVGMSVEQLKSGNFVKIFGLSLVFAFFIALMLYGIVMFGGGNGEIHGQDPFLTFKHGAFHGAIMGLFIILPVIGTISLYERKSLRYVLITVGYWSLTFAIMGGIINAWP